MTWLILSLALAQSPMFLAEDIEPEGVFVFAVSNPSVRIRTAARSAGKQGWVFDVDSACRLAVIESTSVPGREVASESRVLLLERLGADAGVELARSPAGFSSPTFAGDGGALLMIRGANELVRVSIPDRTLVPLGSAWYAIWSSDGNISTYERVERDCHVWKRIRPDGSVIDENRFCGGYSSAAIGSGIAPVEVPVLVLDAKRRVVAILGREVAIPTRDWTISTAERGIACTSGVDFVSVDGRAVTLVRSKDRWDLKEGASCRIKLKDRRERTKVVLCE